MIGPNNDEGESDNDDDSLGKGKVEEILASSLGKHPGLETAELRYFATVFEDMAAESDDELGKDDDDNDDAEEEDKDTDDDKDAPFVLVEDKHEKPRNSLPPLPAENDKKYPQEDKHYFKKKKYVRNDKYTLNSMLFEGLELPELMSAFPPKDC